MLPCKPSCSHGAIHRLQGGVASSAALAYMLAVVMAQAAGPMSRAVQGVLAAPAWAPLSDLSYSAYLYHVQVCTWSRRAWTPPQHSTLIWSKHAKSSPQQLKAQGSTSENAI